MSDPIDKINAKLAKIEQEMAYFRTHEVLIGFLGGEDSQILTIVRANEYGAHIVPKNGSGFLWVPTRRAIQKLGPGCRAKDVPDHKKLFRKGNMAYYQETKNGDPVPYFYLLKKVDIPARPFLLKSMQRNKKKYREEIDKGTAKICQGEMTGKQLLNRLGNIGKSDVQNSIREFKTPRNAPLTVANKKGTNNPLLDTDAMLQAVTYQIVDAKER